MKRISACLLTVLLFSTLLAFAQNPPEMPKVGPEQKNLAYFAGNWKLTGDLKPGPMGPGGKFSGTEHNEWLSGGFFLASHSQIASSMGKEIGLAVFGYDSAKKIYTYDAFNNMGEAEHATGTFDGKVWTWSSEATMGGKTMKTHFILTEGTPASYTFKFEMSEDGNNWTTMMEGKGSKAAGTATKK